MKMIRCAVLAFVAMSIGAVRSMTVDVSAGPDRTITAEEAKALIDSDEDLIKTGEGRFIINCKMTGYGGKIEIREGYLRCTESYALGDGGAKGKPTVVSDGATLEFGSDNDLFLTDEKKNGLKEVWVEGEGVNGCGALCHVGLNREQYRRVFGIVVLTGDTTFGGIPYNAGGSYRRFDIRGGQGQLQMNGHTLTIKCMFGLSGVDVTPGETGKIVVDGATAAFYCENGSVNFNGSAANAIELKNGALLASQKGGPAIAWSLVADNGTYQDTNVSDGITSGRINGPVTVKSGGLTLKGSKASGRLTLGGKISGPGQVTMTATASGVVFSLLDPTSDWTGGLSIASANSPRAIMAALPNATADGIYSVGTNAKLDCLLPTNGLADAAVAAYADVLAHNTLSGLFRVYVPEGASSTNGFDLATGKGVVRYAGDGELVLNGNQDRQRLYVLGGAVEVTGADKTHLFDDINVRGDATLRFNDAGSLDVGTNHVSVGSAYPDVARLSLANTLFTTNWGNWVKKNTNPIEIGPARYVTKDDYSVESYGKDRGILEVGPGAAVTNTFWVGRADKDEVAKITCHGSLFVHGGDLGFINPDGYNFIGYRGSGYFEQTSGSTDLKGLVYPGAGQYGRGEIMVSGGSMLIEGAYLVFGQYSRTANPGMGVYYQKGGSVESWGAVIMGKTLYDTSNAGSRDQFTVAGGQMSIDNGFDLGGEPFAISIVNLNGGEFWCHYMQIVTNELQTLLASGANREITNSYGYVNFNGGTYRYRRNKNKASKPGYKAGGFFYGDPERIRITSFGKGATFDTSGYTVTNTYAITGPTGQGIVSISLPAGFDVPDWAYAGAPLVEISGDGTGASAVAEFDSTNGRVTGITVTSPGWDYTTASAKMVRGGYTNDVALVVTLGTPVSGGLTKAGDGTLRMASANTYGGVTRVEKGTLVAADEDAIPAGNGLEIAGGTLDAGGYEKAYGAISAASGTLENAEGTFASFRKTGPGSFAFNAPLASTADLDVREGTLALPVALPGLVFGEKIYEEGESKPEYDQRKILSSDTVELTPSKAYALCETDGYYKPRHYVSYSGYVWNRGATDVTWTFAFAFDDNLEVRIDGQNLPATKHGTASWGALYTANVTLTPGPHSFHLVLWNAQGNGGAVQHRSVSGVSNWREDIIGLAYDPQGRGSADGNDYIRMVDPGDGSLFTTVPYDASMMPTFGSLVMAPGTALDVNGGTYAYEGDLKVGKDVFADPIRVTGGIAFGESATVTIDGLEELSKDDAPYTILRTTKGVSAPLPALGGGWRFKRGNKGKDLLLDVERGCLLFVR